MLNVALLKTEKNASTNITAKNKTCKKKKKKKKNKE